MKNTHVTQAIETGNIQRIAIKNLVKSPLNVRKKESGGIGELSALIAAQGLIHNLIVTEQKKKNKKTGKYEVVAGGRRLDALNLLVAEERLSKESEVNCRVVGAEEALELSLAENSGREAMHPADLVMAYRNLTEAGLSPDEIAPRFGVSPLTVKRYLKLTHVSPAIFKLYAEDEMNFEQISALALTEDHELQERIWNSTPEWQRSGSNFRRLITGTEIDIQRSPLAKFVGLEKYEAAGGLVRRDLFGKEGEGYIQDTELLESLALEKLNQAIEAIKGEGHAWAQCHTTFDHSDRAEFVRARTSRREPTAEEQAAMDALDAEMEALTAEFEGYDEEMDEDGETYAAIEKKHDVVQEKIAALNESLEEPDATDLAIAGVIVTIDHAGELRIERGLIRKEDVKKLPKAQGGESGLAGSEQSETAKPVHSEKLTRMLTAHRSAAIQAQIMDRPEIALAALVHRLAQSVFSNGYLSNRIVQVNIEQTYLKKDAENIEESRAAKVIEEKRAYWTARIEATGQGGKTLFGWLLEQDLADLHDLLAFCTAVSINTVSGREHAPSDDVTAIMAALNLDMADWWEPTPENYLSHVSKDRIIEVVGEAVSPQMAQTMTKMKKGELIESSNAKLSGLRWLPDNLKVEALQE
ncbi:ParB family chromosome partitioning protein [Nitrosospira sp. Nsp5]|uniref:Chromosome partitioning protein, ParB family n=1 Tax=Nitrosospira multiformis TaxID=1231 RepID=A0ABY0TN00_9PROT|nr:MULTISPECIES: ParB/RepB/Spo0J family partition protein [Nitrosospira]PTR05634.1 ParB family chromosome partitioning protein [Nitrosospira sp. Nsp5]SDR11563.1 chromosome partitioning protein, ParB family [Nitrosospira multiformis]